MFALSVRLLFPRYLSFWSLLDSKYFARQTSDLNWASLLVFTIPYVPGIVERRKPYSHCVGSREIYSC